MTETPPSPLRTVSRYAAANLASLTLHQQIELFTALSLILPSEEERTAAARQAFLLKEAESHQLVFHGLLNNPEHT